MVKRKIVKTTEPVEVKEEVVEQNLGGADPVDNTGYPLIHVGRCTICGLAIKTVGNLDTGERTYSTSECTHYPKE